MRTSHTHPIEIAEVRASPAHGRIGITFCPGKHDRHAYTGAWERDLGIDLDAIAAWGAKLVLTLIEPAELAALNVPHLGQAVQSRGMAWVHLPIPDYSVPDNAFEQLWRTQGREIRDMLRNGEDVLVHCKGGLGRAGMIAARLLVELGMDPEEAIRSVRGVRRGAIETPAQLALVRRTKNMEDVPIDVSTMTRVGGQLGTNPAGVYQDDRGRRYYVKTLESPELARNEMMAARLYKLAGAPTLNYFGTTDSNQVATGWVELEKKRVAHLDECERRQAQEWLGVHAWTANWDAAGFDGDNQGVVKGQVLTLDLGGALEFRAHGDPKGSAFGTRVKELDVLRTDEGNPHARRLFSDMSAEDIRQAAMRVLRISDEAIREVIRNSGGSSELADKMIARKADMARYLEEEKSIAGGAP